MDSRVMDIFKRGYVLEPESGCWLWIGRNHSQGYGKIYVNGKDWLTHRLSWILHRGPIPNKLYVLHRCDVRLCVNPDHLFLGTHIDNVNDMLQKGRNKILKGELVGMAKLTDKDILTIKNRRLGGERQKDLASEFGVDDSVVSRICNQKAWSHVGGNASVPKDNRHLSKLTAEDVAYLREERAKGRKIKDIAAELNIGAQHAGRILMGKIKLYGGSR